GQVAQRLFTDTPIRRHPDTLPHSGDPHGQTAVDAEGLPGEIVVGHQFGNETGDLFGRAFAVKRNALFEIQLLLLLAHGRVKAGADDAWGHAVHADVGLGTLARQRAGELW